MGEIINLNHVRKAKAKAERAATSVQNRAKSGRSKAEREGADARARQASERLAGHRLDPPEQT